MLLGIREDLEGNQDVTEVDKDGVVQELSDDFINKSQKQSRGVTNKVLKMLRSVRHSL